MSARSLLRSLGRAPALARRLGVVGELLPQGCPPWPPRGAVLFFIPEAGVKPHLHTHLILARTLLELGEQVFIVRCFRCYERCPVRDMQLRPFEGGELSDLALCLDCSTYGLVTAREYGLETLDLRRWLGSEVRDRVHDALERCDDLAAFEHDGVPFGRIATMDLSLNLKVSAHALLTPDQRAAWRAYARAAAENYLAVRGMCRELAPSALVHVNDYAFHVGARLAAEREGVRAHSVANPPHLNIDRRRFIIRPGPWCATALALERSWPAWRDLALSPAQVREVADDLISRLRGGGSHQYSPPRVGDDAARALQLDPARRTLVAYTSSLDESVAMDVYRDLFKVPYEHLRAFPDQLAWLRSVVHMVEESSDLQLVVRIHPREGASARVPVDSQHLRVLMREFSGFHAHVRFVWPLAPVSSYDLADIADLVIPSWTTMSLELARLGVPVLMAFRGVLPFPSQGVLEWSANPEEYLGRIRTMLDAPACADRITAAFRWYQLYVLGSALDLADVIPTSDPWPYPAYSRPRVAEEIRSVIRGDADTIELNHARQVGLQGPGALDAERSELLRQLRRVVHFLVTGVDQPGAQEAARLTAEDEPGWVQYESGGQTPRRLRSMLVWRLGRMLAHA